MRPSATTPHDAAAPSMVEGRLGVLGGTFDPVHFGHLDAARPRIRTGARRHPVHAVARSAAPAGRPARDGVSRFALVALAIDGLPGYRVSDEELRRGPVVYTSTRSARCMRAGWSPSQIFFILGADAFAEIATWHQFPAVLDAANFAVIARPGTTIDRRWRERRRCARRVRSRRTSRGPATSDFLVEAATRDVSSTDIRARFAGRRRSTIWSPVSGAAHRRASSLRSGRRFAWR